MHARIFLARHDTTGLTAEDRFARATNVQLSDETREQVHRLAARLQGENIAAIYATPLDRTVETARILAEPHELEVQTRKLCCETGFLGEPIDPVYEDRRQQRP